MQNNTIVGRLTKDVEVAYTQSNKAVAKFTVAVNRKYAPNGEKKADFFNVISWRNAENHSKYLAKGSLVEVIGEMQQRSYENNQNQTVYIWEFIAENVGYLSSKKEQSQNKQQDESHYRQNTGNPYQAPQQQNQFGNQSQDKKDDPFNIGSNIDISDDDLPF